jgi:hypothetical protein
MYLDLDTIDAVVSLYEERLPDGKRKNSIIKVARITKVSMQVVWSVIHANKNNVRLDSLVGVHADGPIPCPWCGTILTVEVEKVSAQVCCDEEDCGARGPIRATKEKAIEDFMTMFYMEYDNE